jgi:hypothetical protein
MSESELLEYVRELQGMRSLPTLKSKLRNEVLEGDLGDVETGPKKKRSTKKKNPRSLLAGLTKAKDDRLDENGEPTF